MESSAASSAPRNGIPSIAGRTFLLDTNVLIHDARVCGVFADAGAANSEGIRRYGEDGVFLVAMVSPRRQPAWKRTAVGDMLLVS